MLVLSILYHQHLNLSINAQRLIKMDNLSQLRHKDLELTNQVLPEQARLRRFSVRYNHCFQRIIIDNLFGRCWYKVLKQNTQPAYKQLTEEQLERAIAIAESIAAQPDNYSAQLNQNSLRWRGKLISS